MYVEHVIRCSAPAASLQLVNDEQEPRRIAQIPNDGSNEFVFRVSGYPAGTWEHYARAINADGSNGERGDSYMVTVDA